jgi:fluoride exporter
MKPTLGMVVGVALLGAVGSLCRYGLSVFVQQRVGVGFPWGTFVVNALGSFVIGGIMAVFAARGGEPVAVRVALTVGLMGGFTTMSSFAFETVTLLESRAYVAATANVLGSVVVCLLGCALGLAAGRSLAR